MRRALSEYRVVGVRTTLSFARWLMEQPRFIGADMSTDFIAEEWDPRKKNESIHPEDGQLTPEQVAAIMGGLLMYEQMEEEQLRRHPVSEAREETSRWRDASRREILRRV